MDFVDATLLRLADEVRRRTFFDELALTQLISAAHDTAGLDVSAPIDPIFDELRFCYEDDRSVAINGSWMTIGHTDRSELTIHAAGLASGVPRIDALWTGSIVATSGGGGGVVDSVDLSYVDVANLDREITPLPSDPAELERRRRAVLLARIRATLAHPTAFDDAELGRLLARLEVGSVAELIATRTTAGAMLRVHYALSADAPARRRQFGIAAALLIRPASLSVAGMLDETRRLRPLLAQIGFAPPRSAGDRSRRGPVVVWVVPPELFDDAAWPGAPEGSTPEQRRTRRRMWAGTWLAREGIGLVVPPSN